MATELGRPLTQNFPSRVYQRADDIWSAVQDPQGLMYFGCFSVTLTYNGTAWDAVEMPYARTVRALTVAQDGTVYAGGYNQLGYFVEQPGGKKQFFSLVDRLPAEQRDFRDVQAVVAMGDSVCFATSRKLIIIEKSTIRVIDHGGAKAYVSNGSLYLHAVGKSLERYASGKIEPVSSDPFFLSHELAFISAEKDGGLLLGSTDQGLFELRTEGVRPWPTQAEAILRTRKLSGGRILQDGSLALVLDASGLLFLDREGRVLGTLTDQNGLQNNLVHTLAEDNEGGLWVGHSAGVSRVEWPSGFTFFDKMNGLSHGGVRSVVRHDGTMGLAGEIRSLLSFHGELLAANETALYHLTDQGFAPLLMWAGRSSAPIHALLVSRADVDRLWVCQQEGLHSIRHAGGVWVDEGLVPGIDKAIRGVLETEPGSLWLTKVYDGFMRVRFEGRQFDIKAKMTFEDFSGDRGVAPKLAANNRILDWKGAPLFATDYGVYRWSEAPGRFEPYNDLGTRINQPPIVISGVYAADNGFLWLYAYTTAPGPGEWRGRRLYRISHDGKWEQVPHLVNDTLGQFGRGDILQETTPEGGLVWLGGTEGIMKIEVNRAFPEALPLKTTVHAQAQTRERCQSTETALRLQLISFRICGRALPDERFSRVPDLVAGLRIDLVGMVRRSKPHPDQSPRGKLRLRRTGARCR